MTELRELRRLADALYPVFAAEDLGERAGLVTDLLARSGMTPALAPVDGHIEAVWEVAQARAALWAAAAASLHDQLVRHSADRLGTCAGARCADAYVDASPGGHRRYCSLTYQNRTRVAAFRRRKSQATQPGDTTPSG